MDGNTFQNLLNNLNYNPNSKDNEEQWNWLFLPIHGEASKKFLHALYRNLSSSNVLTTEELKEYNILEKASNILEGDKLRESVRSVQMFSLTSSTPSNNASNSMDRIRNLERATEEVDRYQQSVSSNKDLLSSQHSNLTCSVAASRTVKNQLEQSKRQREEHVLKKSTEMNRLLSALSTAGASLTSTMDTNFISSAEKTQGLKDYFSADDLFTEAINLFVHRHFKHFAHHNNNNKNQQQQEEEEDRISKWQLMGLHDPLLFLLHSDSPLAYQHTANELHRLHRIYSKNEERHVKTELQLLGCKCSLIHLQNKELLFNCRDIDAPLLEQNIRHAETALRDVNAQIASLLSTQIPTLLNSAAQRRNFPVLSADFNLKLLRGKHHMLKQHKMIMYLLSQYIRHSVLTACYLNEHSLLTHINQIIAALHSELLALSTQQSQQMVLLKRGKGNSGSNRVRDYFMGMTEQLLGSKDSSRTLTVRALIHQYRDAIATLQKELAASSHQLKRLYELVVKSEELLHYVATPSAQIALTPQMFTYTYQQLELSLEHLGAQISSLIKDRDDKIQKLKLNSEHELRRILFVYFFK